MSDDLGPIPGFDADQAWALKQLMRAAVTEGIAECDGLRDLHRTIYGNGNKGLKVEVIELKKTTEITQQTLDRLDADRRSLKVAVYGAMAGSIGSLIVAIAMYYVAT
jgi:hypothetical protein